MIHFATYTSDQVTVKSTHAIKWTSVKRENISFIFYVGPQ